MVQFTVEGVSIVAPPTSAGKFTTVTLLGIVDNGDGVLNITIQDLGGSTPYWAINGLDLAETAVGLPPAAPLTFAADVGLGADALTASQLDRITRAAITRLAAAGEDVSRLDSVSFRITNLDSQGVLGLAGSRSILIDDDGLGHGWFIDPTPLSDEEFSPGSATELTANSAASLGRVDLLTVVMHELGHILGHADLDSAHSDGALMTGTISTGKRRLPDSHPNTGVSGGSEQSLKVTNRVAPSISRPPQRTSPSFDNAVFDASSLIAVRSQDSTLSRGDRDELFAMPAISHQTKHSSRLVVEEEELKFANRKRPEDLGLAIGTEEETAVAELFAQLSQPKSTFWDQLTS
jgi:hypothetical protein